jgi:hypothetical protein
MTYIIPQLEQTRLSAIFRPELSSEIVLSDNWYDSLDNTIDYKQNTAKQVRASKSASWIQNWRSLPRSVSRTYTAQQVKSEAGLGTFQTDVYGTVRDNLGRQNVASVEGS